MSLEFISYTGLCSFPNKVMGDKHSQVWVNYWFLLSATIEGGQWNKTFCGQFIFKVCNIFIWFCSMSCASDIILWNLVDLAKGMQISKPFAGSRKRGAYHPIVLVYNKWAQNLLSFIFSWALAEPTNKLMKKIKAAANESKHLGYDLEEMLTRQ